MTLQAGKTANDNPERRGIKRGITMYKFKLQLFSEGEASSAGEPGTASEASEASGEGTDENISKEGAAAPIENEKKSFSELIKGEYKNDFTEEVNKIFSKRYKGEKGFEEKYNELKDSLIPLMERYGAESPEEVISKISNDERRLTEEAMAHGMDAEDYKQFLSLRADNRRKSEYIEKIENERALSEQRRAQEAQLEKWNSEALSLKEEYPDFELGAEVGNKTFMTALRMGLTVKDAYRIAHPDVYTKQIAESERKAAYESIKNKNDRPTEIGAKGATAAKEQTKVSELTDKELEEIRRRVIMGERVTFS